MNDRSATYDLKSKPLSRRELKKIKTRQAILDSALRLLSERGIDSSSILDITESADLGKGAFYNYFESKDALIAELVEHGIERFQRLYLSSPSKATSLSERILEVIERHQAFFDENKEFVLLFHQARGRLKIERHSTSRLRDAIKKYLRLITDWLPEANGEKSWKEEDRLAVAAMLAGGLSGYRSFRIAANIPADNKTIAYVLTEGIVATIRQRTNQDL